MSKELLGRLSKLNPLTLSFKILCFLTFSERPCKPKEIADRLKINPATARARLSELYKNNLIISGTEGYTSSILPYDILMSFIIYLEEKKRALEV